VKRVTIYDLAEELRLDVTVVIHAARSVGAPIRKVLPGTTRITSGVAGRIRKKYAGKKPASRFIAVSDSECVRSSLTGARRSASPKSHVDFVQGSKKSAKKGTAK
jgi:hypothetical protein